MIRRIIVTGANGAGKTHVAARLSAVRAGVPLVSFDALKLTRGWQQRPRAETEAALADVVGGDEWILEGGPSLLRLALPRADALIWLDPPLFVRTWRLLRRPWVHLGRTRPELPPGNVDWPLQQTRFAWRSLRQTGRFRRGIAAALDGATVPVWRCRSAADIDRAVAAWRDAA